MALPPRISAPPSRTPVVIDQRLAPQWVHWFELLLRRVGGETGKPIIGDLAVFETDVSFSDLASGGQAVLLDARTGERWKIREMFISGGGTDFSGGNRDLEITDGTTQWTVIPHSQLGNLAAHRWGETELPYPTTATDLTAASTAGTDIYAAYTGGTTDDSAGQCTLILIAERTA